MSHMTNIWFDMTFGYIYRLVTNLLVALTTGYERLCNVFSIRRRHFEEQRGGNWLAVIHTKMKSDI